MTEEYKKDVLDYMTGKLTPGTQTQNQFRDNETIQNNLTQKLAEKGITNIISAMNVLTNDFSSNYIIYGWHETTQYTYKTWIAILNEKGEILDILTTYESGTPIEYIDVLEYDENGYIYGIDEPSGQPYYRIIQLNNIAVPIGNNYVCRLRSSYYIKVDGFTPPFTIYGEGTSCIKKIPGEAVYYIFGDKQISSGSADRDTCLIRFSNIVGMPVEWNTYIGENISDAGIEAVDFVITPGETPTLDIYYYLSNNIAVLRHSYFDGTSLTQKTSITIPNYMTDIKVENINTIYVACRKKNNDDSYTIEVYKIVNNTPTVISSYTSNEFTQYPEHYLEIVNGIIFSKAMQRSSTIPIIICGAYYDNKFIKTQTYKITNETLFYTDCRIQNNFNLYKFIIQTSNNVLHPSIVIYDNQYSGSSYQNYNSLIPAHSEIYSNGYIQFARDLYNKQVFENQTLAVVNVPFNYLNDMTLNPTNLLGQTMTTLVSDKRDITKNKYENVYINFLNKINVIDEDTGEIYPLTANYINKNINVGTSTNYNISKLTKVKINFSTPQIISINWTKYYSYYKTTFEVQIEDEIPTSIDFISEDETTTYITKEYHFHKNKNYMISEKVRIGESLQREELMYNNQNVLYDNNQVMVYEKE